MNVLFILADQFRVDCLGHMGNDVIRTPNLDRLAAEGASFTRGFNQAAPCGPSRMCIYTSRYMCSTRAVNNFTPLRDAHEALPQHLHDAGWNPGLVGYNDYTPDPGILEEGDERQERLTYDNCLPGFERVYYHEYDSEEYFDWLRDKGYDESLLSHSAIHEPDVPADGPGPHLPQHFPAKYHAEHSECAYVTDRAIDYVRERSSQQADRGWVLSVNYIKPHPPNICCEPYHDMYDPASMPAPARSSDELSPKHPYLAALAPDALVDEQHLREYQACYYGMVTEVDDNLGRLFAALEDSGQWEDTLIIFSADHAEHLGDHYLTGKGQLYDGGMRIPYVVRDPRPAADVTRGQVLDTFVEAIDSAPTIMQWLGEPIPDRFQGKSVLPVLHGLLSSHKQRINYEFDYRQGAFAAGAQDPDEHLMWVLRDERHKLVHFADPNMPPLLFDLERDPQELNNVAGEGSYAETLLKMTQQLLQWRMRHEDQRAEHWAQTLR